MCSVCSRAFHWACLGVTNRSHSPVAWRCGRCAAGGDAVRGSEYLSDLLDGDAAAAFAATSLADGSDRTYTDSLKRFVRVLQLVSAAKGAELPVHRILPPGAMEQTPAVVALSFVMLAVGLASSRRHLHRRSQ